MTAASSSIITTISTNNNNTNTKEVSEIDPELNLEYRKKLADQFNYRVLSELEKISKEEFEALRTQANIAMGNLKFQGKMREKADITLYDLARCHQFGIQTKKNIEEAIYWYALGLKFNYAPTKLNLGLLLVTHKKDPKDIQRGLALLHEVADNSTIKHGAAQYTLGLLYLRNEFVEIQVSNLETANRYFVSAHKNGHPRAKTEIEICRKLFRDYGIPITDEHLELSLENRISNSHFSITPTQNTLCVCTNTNDLQKMNVGKFVDLKQLSETALSTSDPEYSSKALAIARANYDLAQCYYSGWRVFKDADNALYHCQKASNLNYPPANNFLGFLFHLKNHEAQAFKYFSLAATEGFSDAQYNLACCYLDNAFMQKLGLQGIERNQKIGFTWLMRAAVQGHKGAKAMVIECHRSKKPYVPHQLKPKYI